MRAVQRRDDVTGLNTGALGFAAFGHADHDDVRIRGDATLAQRDGYATKRHALTVRGQRAYYQLNTQATCRVARIDFDGARATPPRNR